MPTVWDESVQKWVYASDEQSRMRIEERNKRMAEEKRGKIPEGCVEYEKASARDCCENCGASGVAIDSGIPAFDAELERMAGVCRAKNHDYANPETQDYYANLRECEAIGIPAWRGILVRMSDKWSRIKRLSQHEAAVTDESFNDTLIDLANYAILCKLVRDEGKA